MESTRASQSLIAILDDVFMVLLALLSAGLLVLEYTVSLTATQLQLLDKADITIALIFLAEFAVKFIYARDRGTFFRGHWWELLASIPVTSPATQMLRLLRLLRLVRLLRLNEGMREITDYLNRFFKRTHLGAVLLLWAVAVSGGTIVFFLIERGTSPQHVTLFDSLWWAITTLMMSSPADIYPTTAAGRILAVFLTFCGLASTGIFTALVASFFITDNKS